MSNMLLCHVSPRLQQNFAIYYEDDSDLEPRSYHENMQKGRAWIWDKVHHPMISSSAALSSILYWTTPMVQTSSSV